MRSQRLLSCAALLMMLSGCCVILENSDPFGNPVQVQFNVAPKDQPNPGVLNAGLIAEINFPIGTTKVTATGFDTENPEISDSITVKLPSGSACRYVEWDGFQFIDRGEVTPRVAARLIGKKLASLFEPGDAGIKPGRAGKPVP